MSEWKPIETAPRDGEQFLAWCKGRVEFFHWQDFKGRCDAPTGWRDSFIYVYPDGDPQGPTHWMPLPDPPKPESAKWERPFDGTCGANRDGDCTKSWCPQLRDNEPKKSGRHCPLDCGGEDD